MSAEDGGIALEEEPVRAMAVLEATLESSPDPTHLVDRDLRLLAFNDAYRVETKRVSQSEPQAGMCASAFVREDERQAWIARYNRAVLGYEVRFDHRAATADGAESIREVRFTPIRTGDEIVGAVVVSRDTTERQRLSGQLRDLEEHHRSLVEHATDLVTVIGSDESIRYASPSAERLLGWAPAELQSHGALMLVHPDDADEVGAALRGAIREPDAAAALRFRFRHKSGGWRVLEAMVCGHRQSSGETTVVVNAHDVSEREALESHLRQRERAATLGRLVGGVAHEFRNLLTSIMGNTVETDSGTEPGSGTHAIRLAVQRGQELLRQLESFGGTSSGEMRVFVPGQQLGRVDRMLSQLLGESIRVVSHIHDTDWTICMDEGQFEQIVVNLALAGRAVMPRGGRLTIEASTVHLEEAITDHVPPIAAGEYVSISVMDEGLKTLDEAKRGETEVAEALEGLAISTGIARRAGGYLWAYREPGRGSCHRVLLPRHRDATLPASTKTETGELPGGSETILVVEDDPSVRSLAIRTLRAYGYSVLEAVNGHDALSVARTHVGPLDLVVTDLVMPQMDGPDMLLVLRSKRPKVRAVLMSGYTASAVDDDRREALGALFLEKPFAQSGLLRTVRAALDESR